MLVLAAGACGGDRAGNTPPGTFPLGTSQDTTSSVPSDVDSERVHFEAADGVRLDGRIFGRGDAAVVLSHMGRDGDTQIEWYGVAAALARRGYLALTYNRRGVCPGTVYGCSKGVDDLSTSWKDVVGAFEYLRSQGARRIVLIGASIGAMSSLYAAASGRIKPAGVIEVGGINHASGYDFARRQIARIEGPKLFASSEDDVYGGAVAARQWYRWATAPKRIELLPGELHGTDMLAEGQPTAERLETLILEFVATAAGSRP